MSEEIDLVVAAEAEADAANDVQSQPAALEFERLQLLTRFLLGISVAGGGKLLETLRGVHRDTAASFDLSSPPQDLGDEPASDLVRYLGIGLFVEGQKQVARAVRGGVYLSLGTTSWFLNTFDRMTNNRLGRPFRRPVESQLDNLGQRMNQLAATGKREEYQSKVLAGETMGEIIDDVLDYVVENPEIADFIQQLIGKQSAGMAGVVRDNARHLSVASDYVAEGVIRRILRRASRQDLPASPLQGKRQDMYEFDDRVQELDDHD